MTVLIYDNYIRVDTTVDGKRRQTYLPPTQLRKAKKLNKRWRDEAEEANDIKRIYGEMEPNQMAIGLCACVRKEHGKWRPVFSVSYGKQGTKRFSVAAHGIQTAYRMAVIDYCDWHGFSEHVKRKLYKREPDPELFIQLAKGKPGIDWGYFRIQLYP